MADAIVRSVLEFSEILPQSSSAILLVHFIIFFYKRFQCRISSGDVLARMYGGFLAFRSHRVFRALSDDDRIVNAGCWTEPNLPSREFQDSSCGRKRGRFHSRAWRTRCFTCAVGVLGIASELPQVCARAPGIRSWRLLFTPGCVRNGAGLMAPVVVCKSRAHRKGMSRAVVSEAQTGLGPYMVVRLVPVVVVLCLVNCSRMVKTLRGLIFKTTANNRMFFF